MNKTFVIGHKKPDTDSVTSAICLSNLKNKLGMDTLPMVLGEINNETKYVLERFNFETPNYLNDVKLQIKDLNYNKSHFINENTSLLETYKYMLENMVSNLPVIDDNGFFIGTVSMKDIAKDMIGGQISYLKASYENIVKTLEGREILKFNETIKGDIFVASYNKESFVEAMDFTKESILIVGDRMDIIELAIENKVELIILTGNKNISDDLIAKAKDNKVNIIRVPFYTFNTATKIGLSKSINLIMLKDNIVKFEETVDVNDFMDIANKTKYSNFPVVDKDNKCLGLVKLADVADKEKKKVILVDHNEYEQSVDGLDEAEIVEIVDHHKIGSIGTSKPINFRNMPVGSTNTILYMLYKENNIEIEPNYAGLMLSGIVSDTLLFASPTTTEIDKVVANALAEIAGIELKDHAMEMFKAGSSLKGKTEEEIFYTDFKNFTINNEKVGISQISTVSVADINDNSAAYVKMLNDIAENNNYEVLALFVTDILTNGSYIYYNDKAHEILDNCFGQDLKQGKYLEGVVSRKKQVVPVIMDFYEK